MVLGAEEKGCGVEALWGKVRYAIWERRRLEIKFEDEVWADRPRVE